MELADASLEKIIRDQQENFDNDLILGWIYQLVSVLNDLQYQSIVHRDIKPSNILMFNNNNIVKIADFGCSLIFDIAEYDRTFDILGTINYLSP